MNRYIDRAVKLNEKQYQILPEAWSLLSKAHGATYTALHNYINFPDINDLSADELSAFLDSKELSISQKEKIKQSQNKNLDYRNGISWCYVQAADKACVEYLNYLIINGIFIEQAILDKMTAASSKLRNAVTFRQFNDPDLGATDEFITAHTDILDAGDIVQELRQEIRAHLTEVDPRPIRP